MDQDTAFEVCNEVTHATQTNTLVRRAQAATQELAVALPPFSPSHCRVRASGLLSRAVFERWRIRKITPFFLEIESHARWDVFGE
jgi:hypothetical protein